MSFFFSKYPIFISHKRQNGQATPEATLIKEFLIKKFQFDVFMDVQESFLNEFPKTLHDKIQACKVFILIIPSQMDTDFLCDPNGWVHEEIRQALWQNYFEKIKIIPIAFEKNFHWPSKENLGNIAKISDFDTLYFDTNDNKNSIKRVYKAINYKWYSPFRWKRCISALLACLLIVFIGIRISVDPIDRYLKKLEQTDSFDNISKFYSKEFYKLNEWYINKIPQNKKNIELNNRYNECLVKSNIRMLIFCYITISLDTSTDSTQETEYINELVDKCYTNNDNTILINLYNNQKAIETYLQFASQVIKTLENESSLKKLDENEQKALLALYMHYFAPKTPSNNKQ